MTIESDPDDQEIDRIINDYATSMARTSAEVHGRGDGRIRTRPRGQVPRWSARAMTPALAVLIGGVTVAAAATGGVIAFGWPAFGPGPGGTAPPAASIGAPQLGGASATGSVFVVDGADVAEPATVLLIDTNAGRVVSRFPTGLDPNIAISKDGGVLFIAESDGTQSAVRAVDTSSGSDMFKVAFPDRMMHTLPPVRSGLALSGDGQWLFAATLRIAQPGQDVTGLVALNTTSHAWTMELPLDSCLSPWLVPQPTGVLVACPHDGRVIDIAAAAAGLTITETAWSGSTAAAVAADSSTLIAITDKGELHRVTGTSVAVIAVSTIDEKEDVWQGGLAVVSGGVVIASRDGLDEQGASRLSLFDQDGRLVTSQPFDRPIWSLTTDGERIIATSGGTLLILDRSLTPVATIDAGAYLSEPLVVP
jgi:hypothetical protein